MATERELIQVIGVVSQAPQRRDGAKSRVTMSVAQKTRYGSIERGVAPESRFLDVAIWDEALGDAALRDLYKGAKVAIEGTYAPQEYNGQLRHSVYAYAIWPLEHQLESTPKEARQPVAAGAAEW